MMTIRPEQCATCIYRPDSPLRDNLPVLEDEIRDPRAPYHFRYARACHSADWPSGNTICAGFAERHGDDCTAVQLVRRLNALTASLSVVAVLLLAGCAAKLTPAGRLVREGGPVVRAECTFLGVIEASDNGARVGAFAAGWSEGATAGGRVSGSTTKMLRHVRNKVAELGGDLFVLAGGDRFELQAEAYRCAPVPAPAEWEPVR